MIVTIGRIVRYHGNPDLEDSAPAIVTRVWNADTGLVNLTIFYDGHEEYRTSVHFATGPKEGCWTWPPRDEARG